jgi:hypothetical protein
LPVLRLALRVRDPVADLGALAGELTLGHD